MRKISKKAFHWYRSKSFLFQLGSGVIIVCLLVIVGQLLYPETKLIPFARLNGQRIRSMDQAELVSYLRENYDDATLGLKVGDRTIETSLAEAGLVTDYTSVEKQAFGYSAKERLVPFSIFTKGLKTDIRPGVKLDAERIDAFVKEVQEACRKDPVDAAIKLQDGRPVLQNAVIGRECTAESVKRQLSEVTIDSEVKLTLETQERQPERKDEEVRPYVDHASRALDEPLFISVINDRQQVPPEVLASWITFSEDADGLLSIELNNEKIAAYLKEREKSIYIAPGTTVIALVDGQEVSRKTALSGQGIDIATTTARIRDVVLGNESNDTAYAHLAVLPPSVRYERTYTKTQVGLDSLLRDLVAEKGNYGIAVHVLSGKYEGLASNANGSRSYITASTYKLFVAYSVLKEVETGRMGWSEIIADSRNAEQCFDDMIVKSDNACAVAFANRIGWGTVQSQMHSLGLSSTFMKKPPTYDNFSTALDEVLFLRKLEQGESLQGDSRNRLISAMKRQIYRRGIPAGVGAPVADKVGFLYGLLHDASIVYSPSGTYVLVIMTDNSSWSSIANAAQRINAFLAQ